MKNETNIKRFKVMPWLRATRDRIYEETKHMSWEEERQRYDEQSRNSPWFRRMSESPVIEPIRPRMDRIGQQEAGSSSALTGSETRG